MYQGSDCWYYTIREVASLWHRPEKTVRKLIEGRSEVVRRPVWVRCGRRSELRTKTLLPEPLVIHLYTPEPSGKNPLTREELAIFVRTLRRALWQYHRRHRNPFSLEPRKLCDADICDSFDLWIRTVIADFGWLVDAVQDRPNVDASRLLDEIAYSRDRKWEIGIIPRINRGQLGPGR
jgi:hypothetical protein